MALEALEEPKEHFAKHRRLEAITAIKEALAESEQKPEAWQQFYPDIGKPKFVAQPEQEPVAWLEPELREKNVPRLGTKQR